MVFSLVSFQNVLHGVQLAGGKPEVLRFIITGPLHQILYFPANDTMLPDCLDFIVFFTVNLQRWCFVVQSIGKVASKEVDVKNIAKSS